MDSILLALYCRLSSLKGKATPETAGDIAEALMLLDKVIAKWVEQTTK